MSLFCFEINELESELIVLNIPAIFPGVHCGSVNEVLNSVERPPQFQAYIPSDNIKRMRLRNSTNSDAKKELM